MSFEEKCIALKAGRSIAVFKGNELLNGLVQNEYKQKTLRSLLTPESRVTIGSCREVKRRKGFPFVKGFLDLFDLGRRNVRRIEDCFRENDFVVVFDSRSTAKSKKKTFNEIFAVSLFSINQSSTQLLFIGVKEDLRRKGLGSFVVCVVEAISAQMNGISPTVCQLIDDNNAKQFWESLYFYDVTQSTFIGEVNSDFSSTLMVSSGPQRILSGNWLSCAANDDTTFLEILEKILKSGSDTFFPDVPRQEHDPRFSDVGKTVRQLFPHAQDFGEENHVSMNMNDLPVPDDIDKSGYVEERFGQTYQDTNTWYAGDPIIESVFGPPLFETNRIKILDAGQGNVNVEGKIDDRECLFLHLSIVLYKRSDESARIRRFLSYVNRCLGMLPDTHDFYVNLTDDKKPHDPFFRGYIVDHMSRIYDFMNQYDRKGIDKLKKELKFKRSGSLDWYKDGLKVETKRSAFFAIAKCYLYTSFEGNIGDISLVSGVLGVELNIFEGSTEGCPDDDEANSRIWSFRLTPCISPIPLFRPEFDRRSCGYFICRVVGTHFALLTSNQEEYVPPVNNTRLADVHQQHMDPVNPLLPACEDDDASKQCLEKIDFWLNWREYKAFPDLGKRVDTKDLADVGACFKLSDYTKTFGLISHEVLVIIARLLDPLQCWITAPLFRPLSDSLNLTSILRLRPDSYLDDVVLELYVSNILAQLNEEAFLVPPGVLSTWNRNDAVKSQVADRLETSSYIVLLNYINNNHWSVVWIRWGEEQAENACHEPIDVFLADSMNDKIISWHPEFRTTSVDPWLSEDVKSFICHFLLYPSFLRNLKSIEDLDGGIDRYVTVHRSKDVVCQDNRFDCGVCSMMFVERLLTMSKIDISKHKFVAPFGEPKMYRLKMLNDLIQFRGLNFVDPCLTKEYSEDDSAPVLPFTLLSGMSSIEVLGDKTNRPKIEDKDGKIPQYLSTSNCVDPVSSPHCSVNDSFELPASGTETSLANSCVRPANQEQSACPQESSLSVAEVEKVCHQETVNHDATIEHHSSLQENVKVNERIVNSDQSAVDENVLTESANPSLSKQPPMDSVPQEQSPERHNLQQNIVLETLSPDQVEETKKGDSQETTDWREGTSALGSKNSSPIPPELEQKLTPPQKEFLENVLQREEQLINEGREFSPTKIKDYADAISLVLDVCAGKKSPIANPFPNVNKSPVANQEVTTVPTLNHLSATDFTSSNSSSTESSSTSSATESTSHSASGAVETSLSAAATDPTPSVVSKKSQRIVISRAMVQETLQSVSPRNETTNEHKNVTNIADNTSTNVCPPQCSWEKQEAKQETKQDPNDLTKPRQVHIRKEPRKHPERRITPTQFYHKVKQEAKQETKQDPNDLTKPRQVHIPRKVPRKHPKRRITPTQFYHKDSRLFPREGFTYDPGDSLEDPPVPFPDDVPRFASKVKDHQIAIAKAGFSAIHGGKATGFPGVTSEDRLHVPKTLNGIKRLSEDFDDLEVDSVKDEYMFLKQKGIDSKHYRTAKKVADQVLYDPTQENQRTAKKFAKIHYEDTVRNAKYRLSSEIEKEYKKNKTLFPKDVFVKWINGRSAVNLVEEQISYHTLLHPSDSIIAVGKLPACNRKRGDPVQYKAIVAHSENGEKGEMIVGRDFMEYFFEEDFIQIVNQQGRTRDMFAWNLKGTAITQRRCEHLIECADEIPPLYTKKDEPNLDGIMSIRVLFHFEPPGGVSRDVHWAIACTDECKLLGYKYRPIAKSDLKLCVRTEVVDEFVDFVKNDLFPRERDLGEYILDEHPFDPLDDDEDVMKARLKFDPTKMIPYYKFFKQDKDGNFPYCAGTETKQISAIRYDKHNHTFSGVIELPDLTQYEEHLDAAWVKDNIPQEVIDYLQELDPNRMSFVRIPPGNTMDIERKIIPEDTPIIQYRQGDDNLDSTCVFSSLCSILFHLGFEKCARMINIEKRWFFREDLEYKRCFDRIKHVTTYLMGDKACNEFVKAGYRCIKISPEFDLLNHTFEVEEFAIVLLWDEDGQSTHVVCVMKGLVFESNASNALHFSKESLDACCGAKFVRVKDGRYFHKQKSKTSIKLKLLDTEIHQIDTMTRHKQNPT